MKRETKIGAFILFSLVLFYISVSYMSGGIGFNRFHKYYVVFDSNNGLKSSSSVLFKGTQVGKITKIEILHDDSYKVKIEFEIDSRIILNKNTKVKMGYGNIIGMGAASLSILVEEGEALKPGSMVKGVVDYSISDAITPTIRSVEELLFHTNKFLLEIAKNTDKIGLIFGNLEKITEQISLIITKNENKFYNISQDISTILNELNSSEYGITAVLQESLAILKEVRASDVSKIAQESRQLIASLNVLAKSIGSGEGTLGKIISSDEMYVNINNMITSSQKFVEDLKTNPSRYVSFSIFGSKAKSK